MQDDEQAKNDTIHVTLEKLYKADHEKDLILAPTVHKAVKRAYTHSATPRAMPEFRDIAMIEVLNGLQQPLSATTLMRAHADNEGELGSLRLSAELQALLGPLARKEKGTGSPVLV